MKKISVKFSWLFIGVALISLGIALMNKSGLGQTAYSGFANVIGQVVKIKGGTILIIFSMICVLGQIILLRKKSQLHLWLQVVVGYLNGVMVNFWIYDFALTAGFVPTNYFIQWILTIIGILTISFGVAIVMASDTIKMPLEALLLVISERINQSFSRLRTLVDVLSIGGSLILILGFKLGYSSLREGTWISMVILGSSMGLTFPWAKRLINHSYCFFGIEDSQSSNRSL